MQINSYKLVWAAYMLLSSVIAYLFMYLTFGISPFTYMIGNKLMVFLTAVSGGSAAFLCKIHKGSNRYRVTGLYTWIILVLLSFSTCVIRYHFSDITDSPRAGIIFVVFFTFAVFAAFATIIGTRLFEFIIFVLKSCNKLPNSELK